MSKPDHQGIVGDVVLDIGLILNHVVTALKDHEKRLALIETSELKAELGEIKSRIDKISDVDKQTKAMTALFRLGDLLGVSDFQRIE
jgi:hypothetical protein